MKNREISNFLNQEIVVNIGMPVYNGENFIGEAIDSLIAQSYKNFEIIISDNASTDNTEVICREYAERDDRIRYVRQPSNIGAAANFDFVLKQGQGTYFMWAAADDLWMPTFIETCLSLLEKDQAAGLAVSAYRVESMLSPLFNLRFSDPLICVVKKDREERVLSYAKYSMWTHKDNLVYALWRRSAIEHVMSELELVLGKTQIGNCMNEYALSLYRGVHTEEVLFLKRYTYFPPGHPILCTYLFTVSSTKFWFKNTVLKRPYSRVPDNSDLEKVLKYANFGADFIQQLISLYQDIRCPLGYLRDSWLLYFRLYKF